MEFERRTAKSTVHLQDGKTLVGLAAPYSRPTELPGFTEVLEPGSFRGILKTNPDVVAVFNHNPNFVLGRTSSGTMELQEDHRGLNFSCELPDTTYANDLKESVKRGDVSGCSFAFTVGQDDQRWEERSGQIIRHITGFAKLQDVSAVTFPAYPGTSLAVRAAELNVVSAETRSFIEKVEASSSSENRQTKRQVIDVLGVNVEWDSELHPRCLEDQLELLRMTRNVVELRSAGFVVDVRREKGWPVVECRPSGERERRRKQVIDLLLD